LFIVNPIGVIRKELPRTIPTPKPFKADPKVHFTDILKREQQKQVVR
jgi:hypothetical protein